MSYDLYIYPRSFDAGAIRAYFEARPNYEMTAGQATYSNEDTGVYFIFNIEEGSGPDEDDPGASPHVALALNYFRPHTFGLEAEPELTAFVASFACTIHDPQNDGMGDGPYSRDGFLSAWNAGNRFGFLAIGTESTSPPPWPADPAKIEAIWKWNHSRARLQEARGDNVFVPKIVWLRPSANAAPVSCVTWTQGVPTVVPENLVSHIVLVRPKRASFLKSLGLGRGKGDDSHEIKLVGMESGIRLRGAERSEADGVVLVTTPAQETLEVTAMFAGSWSAPEMTGVPPEDVCGADLVALMKKA